MTRQTSMAAVAIALLTCAAVGAQAQSAPQSGSGTQPGDQAAMAQTSIRQQIQAQMAKNGFTDVTVMPSSFFVRAKDQKGNPVAMVIGPDTFTVVAEIPTSGKTSGGMSGSSAAGSASTTK